jgi:hypothetical protein
MKEVTLTLHLLVKDMVMGIRYYDCSSPPPLLKQ